MVDDGRTGSGGGIPEGGGEGCACCVPRPVQEAPGDRIRLTQLSSKAG